MKIMILGSGAIKIGQAGEFDYSGSQAIKAMKEENVEVILVNPNIATIQTDEKLADKVYLLPVNPYFVEKIIEKEKPEGILLSFGGQTALNCGLDMHKKGIFQKNNITVMGTPIDVIEITENRELFSNSLLKAGLQVPKSRAVCDVEAAIKAGNEIGYPVIIRSAYSLGGEGSGISGNEKELGVLAAKALSKTNQILVEEYLGGWKEIEYEVMRDRYDNCITVCSMENFDPMGIHTGESIVVAPAQTLNNDEYQMLRDISIRVIRHLGIVGECNIQFALDPDSEDYRIIEVNARLSRSSALASKATGYPLAFIAAKLALGHNLPELLNSITKKTTACFEPAVDYIVVKIPRWDIQKFRKAFVNIGTEMKSVGEVMAISRKFEEGLQKAVRMLDIGIDLVSNDIDCDNIDDCLKNPTDKRLFMITHAMRRGYSVEKIHELTKIDEWFLNKIKNIMETEKIIKDYSLEELPEELLLYSKKIGFSDSQLALLTCSDEMDVRKKRISSGIKPVVKSIDTLAAEYPAETNYLYLTYNGSRDDVVFDKKHTIVIGSGPYRIGSSVEFDWCCVNTVMTLKRLGHKTIMVNCNPETVSTDYDICDRLYFEELSLERILDINDKENPEGIIVSMGGQTPNNIAMKLYREGAKILGTSPVSIDNAENRYRFSSLLDELKIKQPQWKELSSVESSKEFAKNVGYPVLVRPSYVLSGSAMSIALDDEDLECYLSKAASVSKEHPVVISKFVTDAKEIEIDAVANKGEIITYAISEHVENAGVHSGDATMVLPPKKLYVETMKKIVGVARAIAEALKITGPFNIQFIAKENDIMVIECNLRASRSFPFVSKVMKINFIDLATRAIANEPVPKIYKSFMDINYVGVKSPQFSFSRLSGSDPVLGVEMASTGEAACLGDDTEEAFLKSIISVGQKIPKTSVLLSIGGTENKYRFVESAKKIYKLGFEIYATEHTSEFLSKNGIKNIMLSKVHEKYGRAAEASEKKYRAGIGNVFDFLTGNKLDLVINIPAEHDKESVEDEYTMRRVAVDFAIPLITNMPLASLFIEALNRKKMDDLQIKSWNEY